MPRIGADYHDAGRLGSNCAGTVEDLSRSRDGLPLALDSENLDEPLVDGVAVARAALCQAPADGPSLSALGGRG